MRIIFVQPPLSLKERYGALGRLGYIEPPIGLCYLASVAREKGLQVEILDAQALNLDLSKTADYILSFHPDVVGITAVSQLITKAASLAQELKKRDSRITTVLGGCHVTSLPEETMGEFPYFDMGVLGEGEETLSELLDTLASGGDPKTVKGMILRERGGLIKTAPRQRIKDIDRLPFPALDLLPDLGRHYRVCVQSAGSGPTISLNTSRGCSSQCAFCDASVHGRSLRYHSAEYVFNLLTHCVARYKVTNFFFNDSSLFLPFARFKELAGLIKRSGLKIKWSCMSRVDAVNEEILALAGEAGCWQILYGIESGSQDILDFYRKGISLDQIRRAVSLTKKMNISTKGFFMFANPKETEATVKETMDFMTGLELDDVGISLFVPFPGTPHFRKLSGYGRVIEDWDRMSTYIPVFIPRGFDEEKILKTVKEAYRRFYFRPRIILSHLRRYSGMRNIKNLFFAGAVFSYYTLFERDHRK